MTEKDWLGDNDLSLAIYNKKYRNGDETFDEFLDRISGKNESIKDLIAKKKFIFAGRILASRGIADRKVTYSNCYVVSPPEDNIESIFDCCKNLAKTYSYGGKNTALPPYIVICSKKFSEPVITGCVFNNMLTVETLKGNTVL